MLLSLKQPLIASIAASPAPHPPPPTPYPYRRTTSPPPLQKNHLSGLQRKLLKVSFWNSQQLSEAKRELAPIVARNRAKAKTTAAYADLNRAQQRGGEGAVPVQVG